ncbi:MAG: hypothetical protein V4813_12385 [Gemmatimonadota bacterium]
MLPSFAALLHQLTPDNPSQLLVSFAVSGWTAAACFTAARRAELRSRAGATVPAAATLLLVAGGIPVWGAAAMAQPAQALQVAGASVALVFSWEVAGVLERFVRELI